MFKRHTLSVKTSYCITVFSCLFCIFYLDPIFALEEERDYNTLQAFKMLSLPQSWFDTTPVYGEPQLLFYTQEFTYTCSECHVKDLTSEPKKSHLPFGAHKDMFFTHGLNLRCLNCHHRDYPDAFTDHDGSVIPKDQPTRLCRKCHGVTYRDWKAGIHGRVNGYWNEEYGTKNHTACNQCHNPHHPRFPALAPMTPPANPVASHHEEENHHE